MKEDFYQHIATYFPELLSQPYAIACSGGVDSVVLCHLMHAYNPKGVLLHGNFQLRGLESDADAVFVNDLGQQLGMEVRQQHWDTKAYMQQSGKNTQLAARELRYQWFQSELAKGHFTIVLTAHHADDNLETFLLQLSRASGLAGLSGIPAKNGAYWRPLLPFSRQQILDYAHKNQLQWREDSSNAQTIYKRNHLRHAVVPELKKTHPNFLQNFQHTQQILLQANTLIQNHIKNLGLVEPQDNGNQHIHLNTLAQCQPLSSYLFYLMQPYGFLDTGNLQRFIHAKTGAILTSPTHRLLKDRDYWKLQAIAPTAKEVYAIASVTDVASLPIGLQLQTTAQQGAVAIDQDRISFPLYLRKRREGDFFYPAGMRGKKKLSKYFKDEKYSQFDKEAQWLLCTKDAIIWVVGKRADQRFLANANTQNILYLSVAP